MSSVWQTADPARQWHSPHELLPHPGESVEIMDTDGYVRDAHYVSDTFYATYHDQDGVYDNVMYWRSVQLNDMLEPNPEAPL